MFIDQLSAAAYAYLTERLPVILDMDHVYNGKTSQLAIWGDVEDALKTQIDHAIGYFDVHIAA